MCPFRGFFSVVAIITGYGVERITHRRRRTTCTMVLGKKEKKSIYIAPFIYYVFQSAQAWITVLPANTPCLPFLRKRSPDGASPN